MLNILQVSLLVRIDLRPLRLVRIDLLVDEAVLVPQLRLQVLDLASHTRCLSASVATRHVELPSELGDTVTESCRLSLVGVDGVEVVRLEALDGVITELKLTSVVLDHVSHGVAQLFVLLLKPLQVNLHGGLLDLRESLAHLSTGPRSGTVRLVEGVGSGARAATARHLPLLSLQGLAHRCDDLDHVGTVSDLVLQVQNRLMVALVHVGQDAIGLIDVAEVEALAHALQVRRNLVSLQNLHLNEALLGLGRRT